MTKIQVELPPKVLLRWARHYPIPDLVQFSMDDWVKIKPTRRGLDLLKLKFESPPEVDEYGFCTFRFWNFLSVFGEDYGSIGSIVEGNNLYFERSAMRSEPNGETK